MLKATSLRGRKRKCGPTYDTATQGFPILTLELSRLPCPSHPQRPFLRLRRRKHPPRIARRRRRPRRRWQLLQYLDHVRLLG